jgi:Glycosyl transferases group 1
MSHARIVGVAQHLRALGHMGVAVAGSGHDLPSSPPSWPVTPEQRRRVAIRWPAAYEWLPAETWVGSLGSSLGGLVALTRAEIAQPYEGVVLIEVDVDGERHEVAIDYFDRSRLLEEVAGRCPLVFKMQYDWGGYGFPHVVPGGYVPGRAQIYRYLPALRRIRDRSTPRFEVYGRFGNRHAQEVRRPALELLSTQERFRFEGSFAIRPYAAYLWETAVSRVCIDLAGNGDMCHRLIDYLAVGCCVVRPRPRTTLHAALTDGVNVRFASPDLSDLVDICAALLSDDAGRDRIALAAREHFDRYLRSDQLAGYYVDRCLSVLGGG